MPKKGKSGWVVYKWYANELVEHAAKLFQEVVIDKLEGEAEWSWDTRGPGQIGHPWEQATADFCFRKDGLAVVLFEVTGTSTVQIGRPNLFPKRLITSFAKRWEAERNDLVSKLLERVFNYMGFQDLGEWAEVLEDNHKFEVFNHRTGNLFIIGEEVRVLEAYLE